VKSIEIIDLTPPPPPSITITSPIDGATIVGDEITVEWESENAGATDHIHVTLDAEPYVGGQALTGNYTFTDVAPGPHTITVEIADMTHTVYPNPEATDTVTVTVEAAPADVEVPVISVLSPSDWSSVPGPVTVEGPVSDDVGVAGVQVRVYDRDSGWHWDGAAFVDGPATDLVGVVDVVGSTSTDWSYVFDLGLVPPSVQAYNVSVRAFDAAGNYSDWERVNFYVTDVVPDTTPPVVSVLSPSDWSSVPGPVTVEGPVSDDVGVAGVQVRVYDRDSGWHWDGAAFVDGPATDLVGVVDVVGSTSTDWSYVFDLGAVPPSVQAYNVSVRAFDAAGNYSDWERVNFYVTDVVPDTTPPVVSVLSPSDWSSVPGPVTVEGPVSDDVGVAGVQVRVYDRDSGWHWDGAAFVDGPATDLVGVVDVVGSTSTDWSYVFDLGAVPPSVQAYNVSVRAFDAAGNYSDWERVNFYVTDVVPDTTPPVVSVLSPSDWSSVPGPVTVEGPVSDDVGVAGVQVRVYDRDSGWHWDGAAFVDGPATDLVGVVDVVGSTSTDWSYVFDLGAVPPSVQAYNVSVRAFDAAGNYSDWERVNFYVTAPLNAPPTLAPIDDASFAEGSIVSIPISGSDPDVGDTLTLSFDGLPSEAILTDNEDGTGSIDWPTDLDDSGSYFVTVTLSDGVNPDAEETFTLDVTQTDAGSVLYRVNAGGGVLGDWEADGLSPNPASPYLANVGSNNLYSTADPIGIGHPTVPVGTPAGLFQTERFDLATDLNGEMLWEFPVAEGAEVEVRVYLAEIFIDLTDASTTNDGPRVFDIAIDGVVLPDFEDVNIYDQVGHDQGLVLDAVVTAGPSGVVAIEFLHVIENPAVKAIEIRQITPSSLPGDLDAPTSAALGAVIVGGTNDEIVTVTNTGGPGSGAIDITGTSIVGADASEFSDDFTSPVMLAPGESHDITVTLTPASDGAKTASLEITHDGANGPTATVALIGEGLAAATTNPLVVEKWVLGNAMFRVNAGGPQLAAEDGGVPWTADPKDGGNPYLNAAYDAQPNTELQAYTTTDSITLTSSVPDGVPTALFQTERWDPATGLEMEYNFPVADGTAVEVRLYFSEAFTATTGVRLFDVILEGETVLASFDQYAEAGGAPDTGIMRSFFVESDGSVDVSFAHIPTKDNPAIKGIEIVELVTSTSGPAGDYGYWTRVTNPANNTSDVTITEIADTVTGPGGTGSPIVLTACDPSATPTLAPGDSVDCSFTVNHTGADADAFTDTVSVTATFDATAGDASEDSNPVTVTLIDAPPAEPTGLVATDGDGVVNLNWADNTEGDLDTYEVYRSETTPVDTSGIPLGTPTISEYSDTTVTNGTIYFYAVVAVDLGGNASTAVEASGYPLPDTAVIERINAGGVQVTSLDVHQPWEADGTGAAKHPTLVDPGSDSVSGTAGVVGRHPSIPSYAPQGIFTTNERWSNAGAGSPSFTYAIPVTEGQAVDVRFFVGNNYAGTSAPLARQFNITIEGVQVATNVDPSALFGHLVGGMLRFLVTESGADADSVITITVSQGAAENPLVNGIEVRSQ
jgi:hypothetical protein